MKKIVQRRFDESTRDVLTIVQGPRLQPVFWEAIEDIQRFCTRNEAVKLSSRLWGDMLSCK